MSLPPTSDQDAAPPREPAPRVAGGWGLLDNDPFVYSVTAAVIIGCCLLVPDLLNNMIFTFVMLMLGIWIVPQLLKKAFGRKSRGDS